MANFQPVGVEMVVKNAAGFQKTLGNMSKSITGFGKAAVKTAALGAAAVGAAAVGIGAASVKAAVSFESAFAGVIKTTDGLVDEMGNLTEAGEEVQQSFRDLSKKIPTSVEELLAIGELGGQLGIAQEGLIEFTKTIAAMGEATNLTTEEAAAGFAQIANIMGTPQDQISNMGSSVVELGNNFATTERDILAFAQRIAGAGKLAGLTESDIFAIGAAMSSVGVQAEAGGTAVQKVLNLMTKSVATGSETLEIFADVTGDTVGEFTDLFERDAAEAFNEFVQGLEKEGDGAFKILEDLEIGNERVIRSFLSLAGAGDLLANTIDASGDAFSENTALAKEAAQRYATTESKFKIFKNTIKDIAITIGQALLPVLNDILIAARPLIAEFAARLPAAIQTATDFWNTQLLPALRNFWSFVLNNVIPVIQQVVNWLMVNIPVAIQTASDFWTGTLLPALQAAWKFIQEKVIPIIQTVVGWFKKDMPGAVDETSGKIMGFVDTITEAFQDIIDFVQPIVEEIAEFYTKIMGTIVDWTQENWPLIQEAISDTMGTISHIVQTVLGAIQDFWNTHGESIMTFVEDAWGFIKSTIETIINVILGIIKTILQIIAGDWEGAWETAKSVAEELWSAISDTIENWVGNIQDVVEEIIGAVKTWLAERWDDIKTKAEEIWEDIKTAIADKIEEIRKNLETKVGEIKSEIETKWAEIKQAIFDKWEEIKQDVRDAVQELVNIVEGIGSSLYNAGVGIIQKLWDGLKAKMEEVMQWFRDQLDKIANLWPLSEPKDPTSPLRGLSKRGEAFVNNIRQGIEAAFPALLASLRDNMERMFKIASGFSSFGGHIAKLFKDQTVDPIKERIDEIGEELSTLGALELPGEAKGLEGLLASLFRESPGEAREMLEDLGLDMFEIREAMGLLERFVAGDKERLDLSNERARLGWELVEQEEKLLALQEKQQQLKFLQEQFKLLELIRDFDLKPEDILGDITLGLEANIDDLLTVMTGALDAVVAKANEQLAPVVAPAVAAATTGGTTNTTELNFGDVNISNGMDLASFETRVRRIVQDDMRR